jgi:hypothetical protein
VNANHSIIAKLFEEEINNPLRGKVGKQLAKKQNPFGNAIVNFFVVKEPFYNDDMQQKLFLADMCLLIVKNHLDM